jgi:hypothetical protein
MRVMVFIKGSQDSENGVPPPVEAFAEMDRFTEELAEAGVMIAGAGLKSSAHAKRIALDAGGRTVIDGPFAETRELIAGFYIWQVKDMDEALAWVMRFPQVAGGPATIELSPFMEAEDLAAFLPPEMLTPHGGTRDQLGVA